MTPDRLDELERLARKATPGPWRENKGTVHWRVRGPSDEFIMECGFGTKCVEADAAYIAAADPQTMLEMIAWGRERDAEVRRLKEQIPVVTRPMPRPSLDLSDYEPTP